MSRRAKGDPLPGFPIEKQFENMDEIRDYLSGDRIQCLLCGRWFRALNTHVKRVHKMPTTRAYKLKYGIPFTYGLIGQETSTRLKRAGEMGLAARGGLENVLEGLHSAQRSAADQVHGSKAILAMRKELYKIGVASPRHISKRAAEKVKRECSLCGTPIEVSIARSSGVAYCRKHQLTEHKKSQEKWAAKNGFNLKEYRKRISKEWYARKKQRLDEAKGAL